MSEWEGDAIEEFDTLTMMYGDELKSVSDPEGSAELLFEPGREFQITLDTALGSILVKFSFPAGYPRTHSPLCSLSGRNLKRQEAKVATQKLKSLAEEGGEQPFCSWLSWLVDFTREVDAREKEQQRSRSPRASGSRRAGSRSSSPRAAPGPGRSSGAVEALRGAGEMEEEEEEENQEDASLVSSRSLVHLLKGVTITEKRSKFEGHCAVVRSPDEAEQTVRELVSEKKYADATHNIWVSERAEDDGEGGASMKILHCLQQADVRNVVVIVTRWYGGKQLGPDRFRIIQSCALDTLKMHGLMAQGGSSEGAAARRQLPDGQEVDEFGQLMKKERFQTVGEAISWIKYDEDLPDSSEWTVAYMDRFEKELMYIPLDDFEDEEVEVPLHRVQLLLWNDEVFWDRQRRVNRLHRFKEAAAAAAAAAAEEKS